MKETPNAVAPRKWMSRAALLATAAIAVAGFAVRDARAASNTKDLSGVWLNVAPKGRLVPVGGGAPPLNAAGRAAYAKARADLKSGAAVDAVHKYCLPEGVPRLMSSPYPFEIVQAQNQVTIVHESHHTYRIVLMDTPHIPTDDFVTAFMGESVGRWDGGTLVIDTVGFNDSTPLDATGLPHGEKLHVVERLRKTAQGRRLEDVITVEDPEFYTRPWSIKVDYELRPDISIQEYACGEPHRVLPKAVTK